MGKNIKIGDGPIRKRGRPAGKNRVPLSQEERRARNAQNERDRRTETANAMAELAEAAGFSPDIPNHELLKAVSGILKNANNTPSHEDLSYLRSRNEDLLQQIQMAQKRLATNENFGTSNNTRIRNGFSAQNQVSHGNGSADCSAAPVQPHRVTTTTPVESPVPDTATERLENQQEWPDITITDDAITFFTETDDGVVDLIRQWTIDNFSVLYS